MEICNLVVVGDIVLLSTCEVHGNVGGGGVGSILPPPPRKILDFHSLFEHIWCNIKCIPLHKAFIVINHLGPKLIFHVISTYIM